MDKLKYQMIIQWSDEDNCFLLEAGEISSGQASKILDVSRLEILEMMGKWGISVFDDSQNLEELSQEVEQAQLLY
jgi:predicted HTH domain antitoxin